jgi:hypothetical protein
MDQAPRWHAQEIALLAAETTNWHIFLRSHLDIMNDRMDRVSDGSWAWKDRKTYIKEIEVLDINLPDLIIGISLRIENPAANHYFSSIGRTGRALAESKDREIFEKEMLLMIADKELDDYNRILMYFLFDNYNYFLTDKAIQKANLDKLRVAVAELPAYLSSRIEIKSYEP